MFDLDTDPSTLLRQVLDLAPDMCKRVVIVMRYDSDPRFLQAVPARWPFFRVVCLPYAVPGYNGRKLGGYEYAYCFGEPVGSAPGRRVVPGMGPSVTRPTEKSEHPCPRNIKHMRWLVNWWSDEGEMVCDPFMGIGTIPLACAQLGREAIGIELVEAYYRTARASMQEYQDNATLFEFAKTYQSPELMEG